jgi:hypothetical protein
MGGMNNGSGTLNIGGDAGHFVIAPDRDTIATTGALSINPWTGNATVRNIHSVVQGFNGQNIGIALAKPVISDNIWGYNLNKAGTNSLAMVLTYTAPNDTCFIATNNNAVGGTLQRPS